MLPLFLKLAFVVHAAAATTQCYYPNGGKSRDSPCDPDAAVSVCCGANNICLSNKVCVGGNGERVRGSCTDASWIDDACPKFCTSWSGGGTDVISCQNATGSPADYCCDHTTNCCDTGAGRFQLLPSLPATSAIWIAQAGTYSVGSTYPASGMSPSTSGSASAAATTVTATSATTPTSQSPTPTPSNSTGLSPGASGGIGAGIGAIAVLLLGGLGIWVWRRMRAPKPPGPLETMAAFHHGEDKAPYEVRQQPVGQRYEVPATHEPQELMGGNGTYVKPQAEMRQH